MRYRTGIWLTLALALSCSAAVAKNAPPKELTITANRLKGFQKTATQGARTIYTGKVTIQRGRFEIHGHQATVYFHDQKVTHVLVVGQPAHFAWNPKEGKPAHGWANTITYYAGTGIIHLQGKAKVIRNHQTITAPQMNYQLGNGALHATGSAKYRVKVVLPTAPATQGNR